MKKMFDFFDNMFSRRKYSTETEKSDLEKIGADMSKVIPFPELKVAPPPMPEVVKPAHTYYRLGLTDNNRVSLTIGYCEVTFNAKGVDNLIAQLTLFRDQLTDEEVEE